MTNRPDLHWKILEAVARYYTLTRVQIQDLCLPGRVDDGRYLRKHLATLRREDNLRQTEARVVFPNRNGAPAPVYSPTRKGCELVAAELKDESLLHACTLTPNWQHLYHWIRIADAHILLDRASALSEVRVLHWLTEWTVANPEESSPDKRYSLFTLLQETPRLVCAPDASFVLNYRGYLKGVYVEIDRQTSGARQIAASKTPGYAKMAELRRHGRHFPCVDPEVPFTVLHISPTAARRDTVAQAVKGHAGDRLWKFVSWDELRPETALHEAIVRDVDLNAIPLVRRLGGASK